MMLIFAMRGYSNEHQINNARSNYFISTWV